MPALNAPHVKVNWVGSRTGGEIWSTGFWVKNLIAPVDQAALQAVSAAMDLRLNAAWEARFKQNASSATRPEKVVCSFYPANSLTATMVAETLRIYNAGTGTSNHPFQVAVVASLRTNTPSRRGRGRMYLPCDSIGMSGAGEYNPTQVGLIAAEMKTLFDGVNADLSGNNVVSVASHADGFSREVLQVVVDSVPDIQRRRANSLAPTTVSTVTLA